MDLLFDPYTILKFLHIVMAGLWPGMDMGPRSAVVIMLMLGITMTFLGGWGTAGGYHTQLAVTAAVVGVVWLAGLWHQFWVDHPNLRETRAGSHVKFGQRFRTIDIGMRVIVTGILAVVAVWSLVGDGTIAATWLSVKLVLFAVIVTSGIGILICIPPTRAAIFANGSTPERKTALANARGMTLGFVKTIWVLVAVIIWISVAKF